MNNLFLRSHKIDDCNWPCHGSGSWVLASHHSGLGSMPGQSTLDSCWTQSHRDRFFSEYFSIPLSVQFHCQYNSTNSTIPLSVQFHCQYNSTISTVPLSVQFHCQYNSTVSTIPLSVQFHCEYSSTGSTIPLSVQLVRRLYDHKVQFEMVAKEKIPIHSGLDPQFRSLLVLLLTDILVHSSQLKFP